MRVGSYSGRVPSTLRLAACGAMVVFAATAAYGNDSPAVGGSTANLQSPQSSSDTSRSPGPFVRGTVGIEFGFGFLGEAWNLNRGREWLADGRLSVWWALLERATLVVDFHATRVFQHPLRDAFVTGVTPGVRFRIVRGEAWDLFAEIGVGPSWSDTVVPQRGTRFNYVGHTGIGLSRRLGRQVHGIVGFRWLHLSNNGREGDDRNPDIQALGGYAAVNIGF
jgi:hypothetical protein